MERGVAGNGQEEAHLCGEASLLPSKNSDGRDPSLSIPFATVLYTLSLLISHAGTGISSPPGAVPSCAACQADPSGSPRPFARRAAR